MRKAPLLFLFVSACFNAGPAPLNCSTDAPACPDNYICINGRCEELIDFSAELPDLAGVDLLGDMASAVSGCIKGDGIKIGSKGAWLCPGLYGGVNPKAAALCRGSVCSDLLLFSALECKNVTGGFFTSSNWGSTQNEINPQIETCSVRPYNAALFGCGSGDYAVKVGCSGFVMNMQANAANMLEFSAPTSFETFANKNPLNGVICCP